MNNAGGNPPGSPGPLFDRVPEDIENLVAINLTGSLFCCKAFGKHMAEQGSGKIINISSIAGIVGRDRRMYRRSNMSGQPVDYAAAKAGLKMLTRSMAVEWAKHNIQVNGIGPGYFKTDLTRPLAENKEFNNWLINRTPARRWGDPEELMGAAIFLASDASSFVNGHILNVDGGFLISV